MAEEEIVLVAVMVVDSAVVASSRGQSSGRPVRMTASSTAPFRFSSSSNSQ
jgi:hypothetical protein